MIEQLCDITTKMLAALSANDAVRVMRSLLWADARRAGIPLHKVRISTRVNVPDGGVDAVVEADTDARGDVLLAGGVCYQIKSGGKSAVQPAQLKKELFGDGRSVSKSNLKPEVRRRLQSNETYVLVCFGLDPTEQELEKGLDALGQLLCKGGFPDAKFRIWGTTQLIAIIRSMPALCDKLAGRGRYRFDRHEEWSSQVLMQTSLHLSPEAAATIDRIESLLLSAGVRHIHVAGDPGAGKTRLVLEATRHEAIEPLLAYYEDPLSLTEDQLFNDLRAKGSELSAIVVVDDCTSTEFAPIWNKLASCGDRVRIVTIGHDATAASGGGELVTIDRLPEEQIAYIMREYVNVESEALRFAQMCYGSPRYAHLLGESLRKDSQLDEEPTAENNLKRIIAGADGVDSRPARSRRVVVRYLALFNRFGGRAPVAEEAESIAAMVARDHDIPFGEFFEAVEELHSRRILQGRHTLVIVPEAMRLQLWQEWWKNYGELFDLAEFQQLPGSLFEWLLPMFRYASTSRKALSQVRRILGPHGHFQSLDDLTSQKNARFLSVLAEADPDAVLGALERMGDSTGVDSSGLAAIDTYYIAEALQRAAVWQEHFRRSARLLGRFAMRLENAHRDGNCMRAFGQLFVFTSGMAPTEAPAKERLSLLRELMASAHLEDRKLGRIGCKRALGNPFGHSLIGVEQQGLRREPQFWRASDEAQVVNALREVWRLLSTSLETSDGDSKVELARILTDAFRRVVSYAELSSECIDTLEMIAATGDDYAMAVAQTLARAISYDVDSLAAAVTSRIQSLHDRITEQDFHSLLRRYVELPTWDYDDDNEVVRGKVRSLAAHAVHNPAEFEKEVDWLLTGAHHSFDLGLAIAELDTSRALLDRILTAHRNAPSTANACLLSGYLRTIAEQDTDACERILDQMALDDQLARYLVEVTWRLDCASERAVERVTALVEADRTDAIQLGIFGWGRQIQGVSEAHLFRWLDKLTPIEDHRHALVAVNLIRSYYHRDRKWAALPRTVTSRVILQPALLAELPTDVDRDETSAWVLTELVLECINQFGGAVVPAVREYLRSAASRESLFGRHDSDLLRVFWALEAKNPQGTWDMFFDLLDSEPADSWLALFGVVSGEAVTIGRGGAGIWHRMPMRRLFKWIDVDLGRRGHAVARSLPRRLRVDGVPTVTRSFLDRYGADEDVKLHVYLQCWGGAYSGKRTDRYRGLIAQMMEWKDGEESPHVLDWIDQTIRWLNDDVERAELDEERGQR